MNQYAVVAAKQVTEPVCSILHTMQHIESVCSCCNSEPIYAVVAAMNQYAVATD